MNTLKLRFKGITPLLMHSNVGVNPLHPLTIMKSKLTSKRKKTEEDHLKIMDLNWELGIYWEKGLGAYIPAANVEGTLRFAAQKSKKGKQVKEGIFVDPDFIPLDYSGPKDYDELKADVRFRDVRVAVLNRASVIICRPRFDMWSIDFNLLYDPTIWDEETVLDTARLGGAYIGLCDYRPRYGKFEVIKL